ncbi:MAG: ROK family transcriptional regulator [Spirochaetia bacterium]
MLHPVVTNPNTVHLLKALWLRPLLSRIDLAKQLDINKSTVSTCMAELIKQGLVLEVEEGQAGPAGGRKPVCLKINERYGHIVGCEMHQDSCRAVGMDLNGTILYELVLDEKTSKSNIKELIHRITAYARQKEKELGIPLLGVSYGLAGIINPYQGIILESVPLKINRPFNLTAELEAEIRLPLLVDNDANCCCWGEIVWHKSKPLKDFLFLLAEWRLGNNQSDTYRGTAIGLGLVVNNSVHYGTDFSAGEFRSIFWKQGNNSQFSLSNEDMKKIPDDTEVYRLFTRELADNMAFIVNVFNLKHVFLGGFLKSSSFDIREQFRAAIMANSAYPDLVGCEVLFSSLGENAVAYGAACHFLLKMFYSKTAGSAGISGPHYLSVFDSETTIRSTK